MVLRPRVLAAVCAVSLFIGVPAAWGVAALTAPQGATITIAGVVSPSTSCPAGTPVQLTSTPATAGAPNLFPNGVGPQAPRDASGNFQVAYTIPPSTPAGSYTIGVHCGSTTAASTQVLNVTAAATAKPSITVSPANAATGSKVTIAGVLPVSGTVFCPSGDAVQLTSTAALFPPNGAGPSVTRDANGGFSTTYAIPGTTPAATYSIGMRCGGGTVGVSASLQVTAAGASTTTTSTTAAATTTTTAAPASSTTSLATTTTVAPTTTTTTIAPRPAAKKSTSPLRWIALALVVLIILAVAAVLLGRDRPRPAP
ncbi:MAG TPA: hypothetical protein VHT75_19535 [Acidimicrobiales bacterium]|nr:hypothetical protein [Acidimicrobiales bacterium]